MAAVPCRKPTRSLLLNLLLPVDFALFAWGAAVGSSWPAGVVGVIVCVVVCVLDVPAWRMSRYAYLTRGALAAVMAVGALINLPRAFNPGPFDVLLIGPGASMTLAIMGILLTVPCLNAYERLSPKRI